MAMTLKFAAVVGYRFIRLRFKLYFVYNSGAGLEEDHQDHNDDIYYEELRELQEGRDKVRSGSCGSLDFPSFLHASARLVKHSYVILGPSNSLTEQ